MIVEKSLFRVVSITADLETRRDLLSTKARLELSEEAMTWAKESARAHLIVFPAGYIGVSTILEARRHFRKLKKHAEQKHLAVVLGVDECTTGMTAKGSNKTGSDIDLQVEKRQLPFWLFAWAPDMPDHIEWRQRSTTYNNYRLAPSPECSERRLLNINGHQVDVVACGEGFNRTLRASMEQQPKKTRAVVIAAHTAKGSRIWNATHYFANSLKLPTILSIHRAGIQCGQMQLPGRAGSAKAEMKKSFGSTPCLHAGVFTVPTPA